MNKNFVGVFGFLLHAAYVYINSPRAYKKYLNVSNNNNIFSLNNHLPPHLYPLHGIQYIYIYIYKHIYGSFVMTIILSSIKSGHHHANEIYMAYKEQEENHGTIILDGVYYSAIIQFRRVILPCTRYGIGPS